MAAEGRRAEAGDGDITWWMLDADEHFPAKTAIWYKIYLAGNLRHDFPAKKCLLSPCDQRTSTKLHLTFVTIGYDKYLLSPDRASKRLSTDTIKPSYDSS